MDLRTEFIKILEEIGRWGLLRKTLGTSPIAHTGEYDPNDPRYWEGRSYRDYLVRYYWTRTMSGELKSVDGTLSVEDEVCFIAANPDDPQPTQKDTLIPLRHTLDGSVVTPYIMEGPSSPGLPDNSKAWIELASVIPYWAEKGKMVYYVASRTRTRSGWGGRA